MENEIRKLTRQRDSDSEDDKPTKKAKKGTSTIELQNAKYQRGTAAARRTGRKKDESDMIKALQSFRGKLQQMRGDEEEEEDTNADIDAGGEAGVSKGGKGQDGDEPIANPTNPAAAGEGEDEGMEVDDDVDWLRHRLHFATDDAAEVARAEHDYEVIDPRTRGAKAKEEEMERKKARKDGGRGYRAPPPPRASRR